MKPQPILPRLASKGPERQAIEAGEIDAVIDYASGNVILLPAARRALLAQASAANILLAALPEAELWRLHTDLERVALKFGEVLQEIGAPIRDVYFPLDCVVSLRTQVEGRHALEVGLVGRDGMVGISLALGADVSSARALVQGAGMALRMSATRFREAFGECPSLQLELLRYVDAKLTLARQAVACNCFHTVEARLARCLLMTADRARLGKLTLTQAFLSNVLGVRRATVNEAAGPLQQRGLISYSRGMMRILDRKGLEAAACRCYTVLERAGDVD
jgi:CRP-like cAMP-binding protein